MFVEVVLTSTSSPARSRRPCPLMMYLLIYLRSADVVKVARRPHCFRGRPDEPPIASVGFQVALSGSSTLRAVPVEMRVSRDEVLQP